MSSDQGSNSLKPALQNREVTQDGVPVSSLISCQLLTYKSTFHSILPAVSSLSSTYCELLTVP